MNMEELDRLEKKRAYNREYQRTHRKQAAEARDRWRKNHPDKAKELNTTTVRRWRERNREKYNAYHRAYRAKQKAKLDNKEQA